MDNEDSVKTILVVDDKEENRRLVRKVLVRLGYRVLEVASGEEALETTMELKPDLILMDLRLREGMDGIETTRRIKATPPVAGIPIVAVTASVSPADVQRALDNGCSGFIRKPIDIDEFPAQVARYLATE